MANEPTLSEITNISVDPERGTGTPAVLYDSKELTRTLNWAASQRAENDWKKYTTFLGNLKDVYTDVNEIAKQEMLTEDRPEVQKEMSAILKEIESNPQSFFSGGPKYGEIQAKIAGLQSKATESKANNIFDKAHREFFYRNPQFDTPENRASLENYRTQKLGSRQPYQFKVPPSFDAASIAAILNEKVKSVDATPELLNNGEFIQEGTKTTYDPTKYRELAQGFFEMGMQKGMPIKSIAEQVFAANPKIREQFANSKDPARDFFLATMDLYRNPDKYEKGNLQANPNFMKAKELESLDRYRKGQLAVAWENYNKDNVPAKGGGLDTPAILFGEHINRVKEAIFKRGGSITVTYEGTDDKTRKALNLQSGERVSYRPDGTFVIEELGGDKWKINRVGTPEDLKQGFINAVKGGMSADGTQTKEFQDEAEKGFNTIFGTPSGSKIWESWDVPVDENKAKQEPAKSTKHPLPKGQPKTVQQNGYTYTWNEINGSYE